MAEPVWYRSLYWRIAIGFIACVAGLLLAQAALFVWLAARTDLPLLARSPQHLATVVASDVSEGLEADKDFDIPQYLRDHLGDRSHRVIVMLRDGRAFHSDAFDPPEWALRAARFRLRHEPLEASGPRTPLRRVAVGPVVIKGETMGLVVVLPTKRAPFAALRVLGPTLATAGAVLLVLGTTTMAFFVFQPARRRLRRLEAAAEAIGGGETSARALEEGGDEVTALARAFNRMAEDLEARLRELQDVDHARRQLLADVSHELMTPLTAIRGYLETLQLPDTVLDAEARARCLHIVTEETLRLEAMIGDLLDLARLEGGGTTLQREIVSVVALFERAAGRHGPALAERAVRLETHIDPGAEQVEGDARRLEQAIQNLVANAARYTPRGGHIELSAASVDGRVRLRVQDNGPGIAPEHLSRVFDRFYRVDTARDHASGGSGLGLSIVRAIVEAHGGLVSVSSSPGHGACFDIVLNKPTPARPPEIRNP